MYVDLFKLFGLSSKYTSRSNSESELEREKIFLVLGFALGLSSSVAGGVRSFPELGTFILPLGGLFVVFLTNWPSFLGLGRGGAWILAIWAIRTAISGVLGCRR